MRIRRIRINLLAIILIAVVLLHLVELGVRFPCNHAVNLTFCYRDCIIVLALFETVYSILKREICVVFWIVFAFSFLFPVVEDKYNIFISYETWVSRGMPEWGHS